MRFGIYFVPKPASALARFGAAVLGRDIETGRVVDQPLPHDVPAAELRAFTSSPRHYGFHATLKPPFQLASGMTFEALDAATRHLAGTTAPVLAPGLRLGAMDGFLALRLSAPTPGVEALAAACVADLDGFRAPPSVDEMEQRRKADLTAMQEKLLRRWGYPYVLSEFRFHMTLTERMTAADGGRWRNSLGAAMGDRFAGPFVIDCITLVAQPDRRTPFTTVKRYQLEGTSHRRGHCFLVVGPSGSGKDTLIDIARTRLSDEGFHFPVRMITRAADSPGEHHHTTTREEFLSLQRNDAFCLNWDAHGLLYGVPGREVHEALAAGRHVVMNVSRGAIDEARRRLGADVTIINVTAPASVLAARLLSRKRESAVEIERRVLRADGYRPAGTDVVDFVNDQPIDASGLAFVRLLHGRLAKSHTTDRMGCRQGD